MHRFSMHKGCMTNGIIGCFPRRYGLLLLAKPILCIMISHICPRRYGHSKGSSVGFIHIVVGFQNPKLVMVEKGNTKTATRLLLDVLGQTEPVLQIV